MIPYSCSPHPPCRWITSTLKDREKERERERARVVFQREREMLKETGEGKRKESIWTEIESKCVGEILKL